MSTVTQLLTVEEFEAKIDDGSIPENARVELIEGIVVRKMPKKPPHRVATTKVQKALRRVLPAAWHPAKEEAIVIRPRSRPEPDVSVVPAEFELDSTRDPEASEVALMVEVADRSLPIDRGKTLVVYAQAGIPHYWIVNLVDRRIEVHSVPGGEGGYEENTDFGPGEQIPVMIAGQFVGWIPVADLLP